MVHQMLYFDPESTARPNSMLHMAFEPVHGKTG